MTLRKITARSLFVTALAVASIGIASAKSYYITLSAPAKAGSTILKAGGYEVTIKGTDAIFTSESGKSFKVAVTVGQSDKKFDTTSVDAVQKDGMDNIREIDLGGSTTKLQFAQ